MVRVVALVTWALLCGCLSLDDRDLHVRSSGVVLSSFENMSADALDPRFGAWTASAYNSDLASVDSAPFDPGFNSDWALQLVWRVTDPPNGQVDGVGVRERLPVQATPGAVDLDGYTRLVFTHRTEGNAGCPSPDNLTLRVMCAGLASGYEAPVPVAADWHTSTVPLDQLVRSAAAGSGTPTRTDCLQAATDVEIVIQQALQDGECSSGTLQLDNVSLR